MFTFSLLDLDYIKLGTVLCIICLTQLIQSKVNGFKSYKPGIRSNSIKNFKLEELI